MNMLNKESASNNTVFSALPYPELKETIYGSLNRLTWIKKFISKKQKVLDIGCGTGFMITIPLIAEGYDVVGYDLDQKSINYGKKLLRSYNFDEEKLTCKNVNSITFQPDVIMLSEVLEHISNKPLEELLTLAYSLLKPGGIMLITIPNGYGLFELESFLWYKLKIGKLLERLYVVELMIILKNKLLGYNTVEQHPSSLDTSGHIQRFTYFSLEKKLKRFGFITLEKRGGTFFSGPFTNLLFTGIKPIMKCNLFLGKLLKIFAADFYIAMQKTFK
jgi:2-polyprenyl-3-methyl-5-hydroxy-6-metoxy-1,4-benzoquinol methylase